MITVCLLQVDNHPHWKHRRISARWIIKENKGLPWRDVWKLVSEHYWKQDNSVIVMDKCIISQSTEGASTDIKEETRYCKIAADEMAQQKGFIFKITTLPFGFKFY